MTPNQASDWLLTACASTAIIPVLTVNRSEWAQPLANALVAGGLNVLEVTLRTECALDAIREMTEVNGCIVGAGTLLTPDHAADAKAAGAAFGVSPGSTAELIDACAEIELPLLPGAATATEIMQLLKSGFSFLKFFPAEPSGGVSALKAFAGPLPQARFCPTGGICHANASSYLRQKSVVCVGGSWVADNALISAGQWSRITAEAAAAAKLRSTV